MYLKDFMESNLPLELYKSHDLSEILDQRDLKALELRYVKKMLYKDIGAHLGGARKENARYYVIKACKKLMKEFNYEN